MTWHKNESMGFAIVLYILLLVVFLIISSLILRHTLKFSYLSPRFRYIVSFFGIIATIIIIFSIYLLFRMGPGNGTSYYEPDSPYVPPTNTGDLNF